MLSLDSIYEFTLPVLEKIPLVLTTKGSLVASFLIIFVAKFFQVNLSYALVSDYNLVNPRENLCVAESWKTKTIARARSAHENAWEAFAGFAVALLLATNAQGDSAEVQRLANAFVAVRLLFNVVYILAFSKPLSTLRSAVWILGFGITLRLFSIGCGGILIDSKHFVW